jgi:hypothetical protein
MVKYKKYGKGVYDKVSNFFLGSRGNKLYYGEKHAILKNEQGKLIPAYFMGPGTKLHERLKNNDDKKIFSKSDKTSLAHDLRYYLSNENQDIRNADLKMISKLEDLKKNKLDSNWNINQGLYGIKAKVWAEDKLKIPKEKFTTFGDWKNDTQENQDIARNKLKELEQEGYGHPSLAKLYKTKIIHNNKKKNKKKNVGRKKKQYI